MTHAQAFLDSLALARPALAAGWRDGVCCAMAAGVFLWVVGVDEVNDETMVEPNNKKPMEAP